MYKVILADDEKWILESLKGTLDWESYGYEIIGEAYNGIEAFDRIMSCKPDAAFIDIRMPGMNGLELIRKLYEVDADVHCVVASGYAEFEYARQAMQYGAAGYCLKPFDPEEIVVILNKLTTLIDRTRRMTHNELLFFLQERELLPEKEIMRLLERLRFPWDQDRGAFIVVIRGSNDIQLSMNVPHVQIRIGKTKIALLLREIDRVRILRHLNESFAEHTGSIGISEPFTELGQLRGRIDQAAEASYRSFTGQTMQNGEAAGAQLAELDPSELRLLEEALTLKDGKLVREGLDRCEARFRSGDYGIRHALRLYNFILSLAYKMDNVPAETYLSDYDELTSRFGSAYEMIAKLKELLEDSFYTNRDNGEKRGEEMFRSIEQYVREHFRESISVQDISKKFYIHPNYLSYLFKKELHVNFTKYLTDIRMEYACGLLRTTSLTISEIAEQAGYNDYFYFARTFKKQTGITPSEYRSG